MKKLAAKLTVLLVCRLPLTACSPVDFFRTDSGRLFVLGL